MYTLRDYQQDIITRSRQAIRDGYRSILCVLPTGGGKTVIFAQIAANAAAKGKRVLTLVHRQEIFKQTLEKYCSFGVAAGQIAAGKTMVTNNIQVAMVSTCVNRLSRMTPPDLIIIDEGHHAVASSWKKVMEAFPNAIKLFFTATPERMDGRGLADVCDYMIVGKDVLWLIQNGYLVMPIMYQPPRQFTSKDFHITRGDFDKKEQVEKFTTKQIIGDVIDHHRKYLSGKPTISFVCSLEHARIMKGIYRDAGIKAEMIQGGQKYMADRKRACQALSDGTLEILISCDVISEGFDAPVVCGAHLLRKTQSTGLYIQQTGRVLRPIYASGYDLGSVTGRLAAIKASEKPVSYVLDFVGNVDMHQHIVQPREWSLESKKRKAGSMVTNITHCPQCGATWPGKVKTCLDPDCGYQFGAAEAAARELKIETVQAELVQALPDLNPADLGNISEILATGTPKQKQKALLSQAYKLSGQADGKKILAELAKQAGYKQGWLRWAINHVGVTR